MWLDLVLYIARWPHLPADKRSANQSRQDREIAGLPAHAQTTVLLVVCVWSRIYLVVIDIYTYSTTLRTEVANLARYHFIVMFHETSSLTPVETLELSCRRGRHFRVLISKHSSVLQYSLSASPVFLSSHHFLLCWPPPPAHPAHRPSQRPNRIHRHGYRLRHHLVSDMFAPDPPEEDPSPSDSPTPGSCPCPSAELAHLA